MLRLILIFKGRVSFTKIKANAGLDSLAERGENLRASFYAKADKRGITISEFLLIDKHCDTRQGAGLHVPSIKT